LGRIKKEVLHHGSHWVPRYSGDEDRMEVEVEIVSMCCPECGKKWTTTYVNNAVVWGGESSTLKRGEKEFKEHCGCIPI
jgi:uncharacterized protein (UPF0212 family)